MRGETRRGGEGDKRERERERTNRKKERRKKELATYYKRKSPTTRKNVDI
jgi:hypothetical protein